MEGNAIPFSMDLKNLKHLKPDTQNSENARQHHPLDKLAKASFLDGAAPTKCGLRPLKSDGAGVQPTFWHAEVSAQWIFMDQRPARGPVTAGGTICARILARGAKHPKKRVR